VKKEIKETNKSVGKRIPRATFSGTLEVGDASLSCYVLEDGRRIFSSRGIIESLGYKVNANANEIFNNRTLQPYLLAHGNPYDEAYLTDFVTDRGTKAKGLDVEKFMDICHAYSEALESGELEGRNDVAARHANAIIRATSKIGIIALVDEATGYQYARAEDALQFKLKLYLADEMRAWEKTFPDELWRQFAKLTNFSGEIIKNRPLYWGYLVMEYIYRCLDPEVADYLKHNKPPARKGSNYHQWFNDDFGYKKLNEHINQVIGMARACETMEEFKKKMDYEFKGKPLQLDFFANTPIEKAEKPLKINATLDQALGVIIKAPKPAK